MEFQTLFTPLQVGSVELKNRFAVSPMSVRYCEEDGTVSQRLIDYFTERAKGGFGLIFTEYCCVKQSGRAISRQLSIYDDRFIPGLKKLTDSVHTYGAKMFVQLHHAGGRGSAAESGTGTVESPVSVTCPGCHTLPHALTTQECYDLVGYFADAAERAVKAGFDGVDLHCGHGYLLCDFLSPAMNKRTDEFGGDIGSRARLPLLIIKAIRGRVGKDFPITVRMNGEEFVTEGTNATEARIIARMFEKAGVSAINMTVGGDVTQHYALRSSQFRPGANNEYSKAIKQGVSIPVFTVGRMNDPYYMEDALLTGAADLIVMGRQSIADPHFPNKTAEGRVEDICPCLGCDQSCLGYLRTTGASCLGNPLAGYEGTLRIERAKTPKKVVVVGAGPGGMMAAWTAARCGHMVTLLEKADHTGGQFKTAGVAPSKFDVNRLVKYYTRMCKASGVDVRLNTEATAETVLAMKPDAVILATGGTPVRPRIEGIDGEKVVQAVDVLEGRVLAEGKVLVCGGGLVGCEVAEFLQERYNYPTILDMLPKIAGEMHNYNRMPMIRRLESGIPGASNPAQTILGAKILRFLDDGVVYEKGGAEHELRGFDAIVLAMGARPYNPLEAELSDKVPYLRVIGDAVKTATANKSIEQGLRAALEISNN